MGDVIGGIGESQTVFDPFNDIAETQYRRGATGAARLPGELQEMMNMLLEVLRQRVTGGQATPFVESPAAPRLNITPIEKQLMSQGSQLMTNVGVQPIEDAYGTAQRLSGQSLDLGQISDEVRPLLEPRFQQLIDDERKNRLAVGEELTSQGAALGSPLLESQSNLALKTNRDMAATLSDAIMQERQLRGGEVQAGGEQLLRTGAAAPVLASQYASLPRDVAMQQFGAESQAAQERSAMLQQVFDLLLGGAGLGTTQYGTRARTIMSGEELAQRQREAELQFLSSLISTGAGMG